MVIDALSPTNSLIGNPTAQKRLVDSGGLSPSIKGLKNAYNDMVHNDMMVSQVDKRPFRLGENVATAKGAVVYRDERFELIQYAPTTDKVYAIPQLTIPPQINKMYINDLSPERAVIKWQTDHGIPAIHDLVAQPDRRSWACGAWANYIESCIKALDVVCDITGSDKVNVSGGCSGGQTMSVLLSKLASMGDERANAITMMVCVLEPKPGDTEASSLVSATTASHWRGQRAAKKGVIEGSSLARGFAWLRPNDLIWNYVINNYLLGDDPPAFDILFWNADATNLSAALMGDFLELFEANAYAAPGTFEIAGPHARPDQGDRRHVHSGRHHRPYYPLARLLSLDAIVRGEECRVHPEPGRPYAGNPEPAGQPQGEILEAFKGQNPRRCRRVDERHRGGCRKLVALLDGMAPRAVRQGSGGAGWFGEQGVPRYGGRAGVVCFGVRGRRKCQPYFATTASGSISTATNPTSRHTFTWIRRSDN